LGSVILFAVYRQKASYGFALGKITGHPLLQRQRAWSTYWYGQGASGQRKGWGRDVVGSAQEDPEGIAQGLPSSTPGCTATR